MDWGGQIIDDITAVDAVGVVGDALDVLIQDPLGPIGDDDLLDVMREWESHRRRMAAFEHKLIREVENRNLPEKAGVKQTSTFLAQTALGCLTRRSSLTEGGALRAACTARGLGHHAALRQLANRLVGILHGCLRTRSHSDETAACHTTSKTPPPLDNLRTWDVYRTGAHTKLGAASRRSRPGHGSPSTDAPTSSFKMVGLEGEFGLASSAPSLLQASFVL
ncbi:hypothetical protein ACFXG4_19995 [Nocardia sp. NPDC059246]|uniref:hypothetical protein n=1 Tax=unclassified Nocardia TaxID=2637762 RepID=UPI00369E35C5